MQNEDMKKSNKFYKIQVDLEWRQRILDKQNEYLQNNPYLKNLKEKIEKLAP
jgi:hypothetical protein